MAPGNFDVLVADRGVDAVLVDRDGRRPLLVLNPHASFGAAVRAVCAVAPRLPRDSARALIRKHLPDAIDLDAMLPVDSGQSATPWPTPEFPLRRVMGPVVVVLLLISVGFYALNGETRTRMRDYRTFEQTYSQGQIAAAAAQQDNALADRTEAPAGAEASVNAGMRVAQKGGSSDGAGVAHGSLAGADPNAPLLVLPPHGSLPELAGAEPVKPCPRSVLDTLAVAYFRDVPTSSTSISNTVRLPPSLVSKDLALSLPCTITRMPRCKDSAAFSAACRQTEQPRNSASPSFHSSPTLTRGVDATVKLQTAAPDGVKRSSGSEVRLPTTVITGSPDTEGSPSVLGRATDAVSGLVGSILGD